jgi:hypothetical protein
MPLMPPAQYDHLPRTPVLEYVMSESEIQKRCIEWTRQPPEADMHYGGCASSAFVGRWLGPLYLAMMGGVPVFWTPPNGKKCVPMQGHISGARGHGRGQGGDHPYVTRHLRGKAFRFVNVDSPVEERAFRSL